MQVNMCASATPLAKRIVDILSAISYPPRMALWMVDDISYHRFMNIAIPERYSLSLVVKVTDVVNGNLTNIVVRAFHVEEKSTDEDILESAYKTIQQFEAHECAEHFEFKGVKVHDPHAADLRARMDSQQESERLRRRELEMARARDASAGGNGFEGTREALWKWEGPRPHLDKDWGVPSLPAAPLVCNLPMRSEGTLVRRWSDLQAVGSRWPRDPAATSRKGRIRVENRVYKSKMTLNPTPGAKAPWRVA